MSETTTPDASTLANGSRTITEVTPAPAPEPNKLIIDLGNLSEGSLRTVKRELKVVLEDYAYRKMINDIMRVTEGK